MNRFYEQFPCPQEALPGGKFSTSSELYLLLQDRQRMLDSLMQNLRGMVYCCLYDEAWSMV